MNAEKTKDEKDEKSGAVAGRCGRCGKYTDFTLEGVSLCDDCRQLSGSCCPEFGADDLWQARENAG